MVLFRVRLSERSKTRAAALIRLPVPKLPLVPPLPTCSVPPLTVILPEKSLLPLLARVRVPLPCLVRLPLPLRAPVPLNVYARLLLLTVTPAGERAVVRLTLPVEAESSNRAVIPSAYW